MKMQDTRLNSTTPIAVRVPVALHISGYSRSMFYRRAKEGKIKLKKVGRTTLVDYASLCADVASLPTA